MNIKIEMSEKRKNEILIVSSVMICLGLLLAGFGGIVLALFLIGIMGVIYGACKKEKWIWVPSLVGVLLIITGGIVFFILLVNSGM